MLGVPLMRVWQSGGKQSPYNLNGSLTQHPLTQHPPTALQLAIASDKLARVQQPLLHLSLQVRSKRGGRARERARDTRRSLPSKLSLLRTHDLANKRKDPSLTAPHSLLACHTRSTPAPTPPSHRRQTRGVDGTAGEVRAELDAEQLQNLIATLEAAQKVRQSCH